jgi:hypothetical protein
MKTLKIDLLISCFGILFIGLNCYGQKEIQYKNWKGEMCELIHYEKTSTSLRMTIISYETKDTSCLIIEAMNDEVLAIIEHLEAHSDADDGWVYKEPNVPGLLSVHLRKPFPEDTTLRANYVNSYDESKLLMNSDQ